MQLFICIAKCNVIPLVFPVLISFTCDLWFVWTICSFFFYNFLVLFLILFALLTFRVSHPIILKKQLIYFLFLAKLTEKYLQWRPFFAKRLQTCSFTKRIWHHKCFNVSLRIIQNRYSVKELWTVTSGHCWNNQSADFVLHRACLRLKSIFWSIIAMKIFSKFLFSYDPKEHLTQLVSRNLFWSFLWHLFWRLPVKGYFCNNKGRT